MEKAGFMTSTAASHQGAIKMMLLHCWGAVSTQHHHHQSTSLTSTHLSLSELSGGVKTHGGLFVSGTVSRGLLGAERSHDEQQSGPERLWTLSSSLEWFWVQHLAQGPFGMQMGQTGDRTADLQGSQIHTGFPPGERSSESHYTVADCHAELKAGHQGRR
ncbi:unnamed protein product [Pleuronectes platessa]|uniref:Uncharacterized protein n=1 Tax=Pleuronectes platessa TaxID=8262 RepID=A0A9N7VQF1_PLEPL|nr:unnamed protein product [Pleuronectes platessa]